MKLVGLSPEFVFRDRPRKLYRFTNRFIKITIYKI
jgi:hypothetical protein